MDFLCAICNLNLEAIEVTNNNGDNFDVARTAKTFTTTTTPDEMAVGTLTQSFGSKNAVSIIVARQECGHCFHKKCVEESLR